MEDLDLLNDFMVESSELIEQLDRDLVQIENDKENKELLNNIFRVAHTIKGSSSFLNLPVLTELTHHMEDVLNKARQKEIKLEGSVMDTVLESIDMMKLILEEIKEKQTDKDYSEAIKPICEKLEKIEEFEDELNVETYKNLSAEELEEEINRLMTEKKLEVKEKKKVVEVVESKEETKEEPQRQIQDQTIRVEVKRLDHLMNLIGELVLGKNRLLKIYNDVEERYEGEKFLEELNQVVSSISLVTTDLQIAVMKTRMLPIAKVFNKFPRMVRDLSKELNKSIDLEISGEETELDKSIVEEIGDPLVHIIRNSCDHGVETPEIRKSKGKEEKGLIKLKAYNEGNNIIIEIADNGKGLNAEELKEKAIHKGIITEREAAVMSEKDSFSLIFKPGFSTAKEITNISGRGVGMDVVKTNIEKLNGIIDVDSIKDQGTVIKLKIPLTLAIIQSLLVGVQEECYAIPLSSVLETVRIPLDEISFIEGKSVLRLRDEVLSLVNLSDIFETKSVFNNSDFTYVVIIGLGDMKLGLVVDHLVGQEEIVIKSLGDYLQGIPGVAGATIRGDGKVTLIVDVAALFELAKNVKTTEIKEELTRQKTKPEDYTVIIVDDSAMDRNIMRKSIQGLGVKVLECANGQEALDMLKNAESVDAMLIDIEMPRMDGYTVASEIKKYSKYKNLPLIAVTSRTSKSDRLRGIEVGMTEYITKPYSSEYLESVVKKNIRL